MLTVLEWLRVHPRAWVGWSSLRALDGGEIRARLDRLQRHVFPYSGRTAEDRQQLVERIDEAVAFLRCEHRGDYAARVEKGGTA